MIKTVGLVTLGTTLLNAVFLLVPNALKTPIGTVKPANAMLDIMLMTVPASNAKTVINGMVLNALKFLNQWSAWL